MLALEIFSWSVIGALAAWRVASLLHDEPGPWGCMDWFRKRLGVEYVDDEPVAYPGWLQPLECFWCLALVSAIPWGFFSLWLGTSHAFVVWLATSTIIIIIERWIGRSKSRLY